MSVFTNQICPVIGAIAANITIFAPVNSLRKAISRGYLGELNPVPFAVLSGNTLGWTIFACLKKDIYIALANTPGLFFSIWLNAGAIKLQYLESQRKELSTLRRTETLEKVSVFSSNNTSLTLELNSSLPLIAEDEVKEPLLSESPPDNIELQLPIFSNQEIVLLATIFAWIIILSVINIGSFTHDHKIDIIGVFTNVNLVFFFAAPLSTIQQVKRTKDSSSIHRPLMIAMIAMSAFLFIYGLATHDGFIIFPNAIGFFLGLIQGLICFIYPKK